MADYNKNKITLKYLDINIERLYLDSIFDSKKLQHLFIMALTFFIYILYTTLDFYVVNEEKLFIAVPFHLSMLLLWTYLIPSTYYNFLAKFTRFVLSLMPIYAVIGTLAIAYYDTSIYVSEIYVILFWTFVTIGYMFLESVIIGSIMVALSATIIYIFDLLAFEPYMVHLFLMLSAWTLGLLAGYLIELYSRNNYENKMKILSIQDELKDLASKDSMTNLYNRRHFYDVASDIFNIFIREKNPTSIIMIDIDDFKLINDTYGHSAGDEVIKKLAKILQKNTRANDIIARFGGEEFVVLLPNTTKEGASHIASKLRETVEAQSIEIDEWQIISFTISLGVAELLYDEILFNDKSIDCSLNRADKALYQAKENGKNRVVVVKV